MADPQPGIFAQGLAAHFHTEFRVKPTVGTEALRDAIAAARREAGSFNGPNVVWGFSPAVWERLNPSDLPDSVKPFAGVHGATGLAAPSTQYDIWVWCSSYAQAPAQHAAAKVIDWLKPVAHLELEIAAHTTPDSRDPLGFIDGTENPLLDEAFGVALFPPGSVGEGGTAALVQKWVHRLPAFHSLPQREQEEVIGRTREESIELTDDEMPATSHASRNKVLDADGEERHIYRRNTPFENSREAGTQFIGCSNDPDLVLEMLRQMLNASGDGLHDRLAEFSTAVTGSQYFVPSMTALLQTFGPMRPEDD